MDLLRALGCSAGEIEPRPAELSPSAFRPRPINRAAVYPDSRRAPHTSASERSPVYTRGDAFTMVDPYVYERPLAADPAPGFPGGPGFAPQFPPGATGIPPGGPYGPAASGYGPAAVLYGSDDGGEWCCGSYPTQYPRARLHLAGEQSSPGGFVCAPTGAATSPYVWPPEEAIVTHRRSPSKDQAVKVATFGQGDGHHSEIVQPPSKAFIDEASHCGWEDSDKIIPSNCVCQDCLLGGKCKENHDPTTVQTDPAIHTALFEIIKQEILPALTKDKFVDLLKAAFNECEKDTAPMTSEPATTEPANMPSEPAQIPSEPAQIPSEPAHVSPKPAHKSPKPARRTFEAERSNAFELAQRTEHNPVRIVIKSSAQPVQIAVEPAPPPPVQAMQPAPTVMQPAPTAMQPAPTAMQPAQTAMQPVTAASPPLISQSAPVADQFVPTTAVSPSVQEEPKIEFPVDDDSKSVSVCGLSPCTSVHISPQVESPLLASKPKQAKTDEMPKQPLKVTEEQQGTSPTDEPKVTDEQKQGRVMDEQKVSRQPPPPKVDDEPKRMPKRPREIESKPQWMGLSPSQVKKAERKAACEQTPSQEDVPSEPRETNPIPCCPAFKQINEAPLSTLTTSDSANEVVPARTSPVSRPPVEGWRVVQLYKEDLNAQL